MLGQRRVALLRAQHVLLRRSALAPASVRTFAALSIRDGRVALWEREFARQQEERAAQQTAALAANEPIDVHVNLGSGASYAFRGVKGVSTPIDVLKRLSDEGVAKVQALAAQLDGADVVDLRAVLDRSCALQLLECVKRSIASCSISDTCTY